MTEHLKNWTESQGEIYAQEYASLHFALNFWKSFREKRYAYTQREKEKRGEGKKGERETETDIERGGRGNLPSISSLPIVAKARVEPFQSQEPKASSRSPTWVTEAQVLRPFTAFLGQERDSTELDKSTAVRLEPAPTGCPFCQQCLHQLRHYTSQCHPPSLCL